MYKDGYKDRDSVASAAFTRQQVDSFRLPFLSSIVSEDANAVCIVLTFTLPLLIKTIHDLLRFSFLYRCTCKPVSSFVEIYKNKSCC